MALPRFRFGDWQVDPNSNSLSRGGERKQLEPRAIEVLVALCRRQGAVVSVEELLAECWGSALHGDNPVHKILTQLRQALGDPVRAPRYIETIRKRGYRAIATVCDEDAVQAGSWLEASPFRGLEAFREQHSAIFFGRRRAAEQLHAAAQAQIAGGCAMVLVLGPSGSGKTSLVRAGLLPQLAAGAAASVLHFDCADCGDNDPFLALASVLLDAEAHGRRVFEQDSAASLGLRLAQAPGAVVAQLRAGLDSLSTCLFIDRFEALFRLPQAGEALRADLVAVLEMLAGSGRLLLVLACRNDFYPRLVAYPALLALKSRGGHVDLNPPSSAEIAQIIRLPALAASLHFGTDTATGAALDDTLCQAAQASPDMLPLLQYCLHELYRRRAPSGELSYAVFRELGGIEGALGARAEQLVAGVTPLQLAALPRVLSLLVNVAEDELAVTGHHLPWSVLRSGEEQELVRTLIDARLFVSDLQGNVPSFGIAHEALLRCWPRVAAWISEHRQALQLRARLRLQAVRWQSAGRARDLLLPRGSQSAQAGALLRAGEFSLSAGEQDFVRASLQRVRLGQRLRLGTFALVTALALLASSLGLVARAEQRAAEQHRTEAEGLMGFMLGDFVDKLRPLGRLDLLDSVSARALHYLARDDEAADATSLTQRARALEVLGELRIARGDPAGAATALQAGRAILLRQLQDRPDAAELLVKLGSNAFWLGQISLDRNAWLDAQRHFADYRSYADRYASTDPPNADGWIEQSYAHNSLGTLALRRGDAATAQAEFLLSIALKTRALAQRRGDPSLAAELADSLSWAGSSAEAMGALDAAWQWYDGELRVVRALSAAAPGDLLWTRKVSMALHHRAALRLARGQHPAALQDYQEGNALLEAMINAEPTSRQLQANLLLGRLSVLHIQAIDGGAAAIPALDHVRRQVAVLTTLDPANADWARLEGLVLHRSAAALHKAGQVQEALTQLDAAQEGLQRVLARNAKDLRARTMLADSLLLRAAFARARGLPYRGHCQAAIELLGAQANASTHFQVLDPWVRSHHCIAEGAAVMPASVLLDRMGYRAHTYLHSPFLHP